MQRESITFSLGGVSFLVEKLERVGTFSPSQRKYGVKKNEVKFFLPFFCSLSFSGAVFSLKSDVLVPRWQKPAEKIAGQGFVSVDGKEFSLQSKKSASFS